jgi:hypothetical protein
MERTLGIFSALLLVLLLASPAAGVTVHTFRPELDTIVSCDVRAIAEGQDGMVAFATSSGISMFDGGWTSFHCTPWKYETGMRDDYLRSLSFDAENSLWIGYAAGIQTYDGDYFFNIDEGLIFRHMPVHAILRRGDEIWIAIGNSGLQRYSNGNWTWFRPFHAGGLNAYTIDHMALDHETGSIYALSVHHGLWKTMEGDGNDSFEQVCDIPDIDAITGLTDYPFGGVMLYNDTSIYHYSPSSCLTLVLVADELGSGDIRFSDIRAAEDATLLIGTNTGMYEVHDHEIQQHISRSTTDLQNNNIIRVFPDSSLRYWFVTPYETGYYIKENNQLIPIEIIDPSFSPDIAAPNPKPLEVKIIYTEAR